MAIYSLGMNTTVTTTGAAAMDLHCGVTAATVPRLMECSVSLITNTLSTYALGRPANSGAVVQTSPTLLQAENPGDPAANSQCAVTWSTAPTAPPQFFRRVQFNNVTNGQAAIWTWPRGLTIGATGAGYGDLVVWNLATNSNSTNVHWVVDE